MAGGSLCACVAFEACRHGCGWPRARCMQHARMHGSRSGLMGLVGWASHSSSAPTRRRAAKEASKAGGAREVALQTLLGCAVDG